MSRISTLAIAAALLGSAVLMPTTAGAAPLFTIHDTGGFTGTVPVTGNLIITGSNGFANGGGTLEEGGLSGGAGTVDIWYLGKEAGYTNTLFTPGDSQANTGAADVLQKAEGSLSAINRDMTFNHTGGLLPLSYEISGVAGTPNWTNGNPPTASNGVGVIFGYLASLNDWTIVSYATNVVLFALDDSGANENNNHDDWIGVAMVTPIPGAIFLFGPALAGLAWMRRRRQAGAAKALPA